jgi:hypothetical protein
VENSFAEYIGSVWREIRLCVKILIVVVIFFVLLQAAEIISLYINVTSGGLEPASREIFLCCFYGLLPFFLIFVILIPLCFIVALINIDEPINIFLTVVAVVIAVASFKGGFYLRDDKLKFKPEPDSTRCVGYNTLRGKGLKELGFKLNRLKSDKDFVFTEQFLEPNPTNYILTITRDKFVLNSNLLNKKPSQIPENIVIIFESNIPYGKGNTGGPNNISTWWHYGRGSLMVFGDGRVEFVKTEDFNNLRWKP